MQAQPLTRGFSASTDSPWSFILNAQTRHEAAFKVRMERTLKKTNKRIAGGWSDPLGQKARIEKRLLDAKAA